MYIEPLRQLSGAGAEQSPKEHGVSAGKELLRDEMWLSPSAVLTARYSPLRAIAILCMAIDASFAVVFDSLVWPPSASYSFAAIRIHVWMSMPIPGIFRPCGIASFDGGHYMADIGRNVAQAIRKELFETYWQRLATTIFLRQNQSPCMG